MEYKLIQFLHIIAPKLRIAAGVICLTLAFIGFIIPVIPGLPFLIAGLLLLLPLTAKTVRRVQNIRKGVLHLATNFSFEKMKMKLRDFKRHFTDLLRKK